MVARILARDSKSSCLRGRNSCQDSGPHDIHNVAMVSHASNRPQQHVGKYSSAHM